MPIRLLCRCKRLMILPKKYTGQHIQCPACKRMIRIPTGDEDGSLTRWRCTCGQRLKARATSAGRSIICPRCRTTTTVPLPPNEEKFIEEKFRIDQIPEDEDPAFAKRDTQVLIDDEETESNVKSCSEDVQGDAPPNEATPSSEDDPSSATNLETNNAHC